MHNSAKLSDHISALIRVDGPLTVARYMNEVLNNPTLGYYANNNPIGEAGDFVTAPEISQMYGELVSACEKSLSRLGVDAIDIYQFHGLVPENYRSAVDRLYPTMEQLQQAGKIIGSKIE